MPEKNVFDRYLLALRKTPMDDKTEHTDRGALQSLLQELAQTPQKRTVYPDGALLHALRVPFGYWEAKDIDDDLDDEIEKKFRRGYPQDNIIFEDSREANDGNL